MLLPPYDNEKSEAGVVLSDVGNTNYTLGSPPTFFSCAIGSPFTPLFTNYFDNLRNGIIAKNSNLQSLNNVFQNIVKGNGIYAISDDKHMNSLTVNKVGINTNKFIDCNNGIYTQNIFYHNIIGAEFRSSKTQVSSLSGNNAIWASTYKNEYFRILNNTIYNYQNGRISKKSEEMYYCCGKYIF
jgi:hypothetical protein